MGHVAAELGCCGIRGLRNASYFPAFLSVLSRMYLAITGGHIKFMEPLSGAARLTRVQSDAMWLNTGVPMLTLRTLLKATRQMGSYGELRNGALDHLPSRLMGYRNDRRSQSEQEPTKDCSGFVRRWDETRGKFIYVED